MKRNKKLMLTAIAAMGVVAMGVGGAGTFAWYQATGLMGAAKTTAADVSQISTVDPGYSAESVDLPIKVTVSRVDGESALELAHWYADDALTGKKNSAGKTYVNHDATPTDSQVKSTAGLYTAYYKTTSLDSEVYNSEAKAGVLYATYSITVTVEFPSYANASASGTHGVDNPGFDQKGDGATVLWVDANGNKWDQAGVLDELEETYVKFSVARDNTRGASRAMFFGADNDTEPADPANGSTSISNAVAAPVQLSDIANGQVVGYFGVYVEGLLAEEAIDTGTIYADFVVTVEKNV